MAKKKSKTGIKDGRPRAVDLVCGCGGLTLGLKQAGFDVVGAMWCGIGRVPGRGKMAGSPG